MFYRTIFVCFVGFVLVKLVKTDSSVITFNIQTTKLANGRPFLNCDHSEKKIEENLYTVYEGEIFTIVTKYNKTINDIKCHALTNENIAFSYKNKNINKELNLTFTGEKIMGTPWKCTILTHRNNTVMQPVIQHKDGIFYSAAYCYVKIHVRRKEAPQTILVNNMELPVVRTNLSYEDADFTAEYQYKDGDFVKVACINFRSDRMLTMEYKMAELMSDESTMYDLKSSKTIGFSTRLHSGHENSYMICTHTEEDDYTKVMVRFVKRTKFNSIGITINGTVLQPHLNNNYEIEYKYVINQLIILKCEVERTDVKLLVIDKDFVNKVASYKTESTLNKTKEMKFFLSGKETGKQLECSIDYPNGTSAEQVRIYFTTGNFPVEQYPLHMTLPPNGRVMELYNDYKLNVIYYEFNAGETVQLTCGQLRLSTQPGPVLYLELDSKICETNNCTVSTSWSTTRKNDTIVCYLKEKKNPSDTDMSEHEHRAIKVIFRERVLTTTTTSTTTTTMTTSSTSIATVTQPPFGGITSAPSSNVSLKPNGTEEENGLSRRMTLVIILCCVVCIIIICASIVIIKLRKRNHSQGGPHNRNYENLQEPSEGSIPAYPPQWENNYAVPVDRRTEDTTYSVPCPPADLYATPTPKNLRNKKLKPLDPTYAVLSVPNHRGQKNMFKETEDPNYSEVYANRPEACYAKVLPKSQRNKVEQDNPYSYVTNDRPCAYTADPEPMYCEPGKARDAEYANLNNSHYANSNVPEYVEPTYCEPQERMK